MVPVPSPLCSQYRRLSSSLELLLGSRAHLLRDSGYGSCTLGFQTPVSVLVAVCFSVSWESWETEHSFVVFGQMGSSHIPKLTH